MCIWLSQKVQHSASVFPLSVKSGRTSCSVTGAKGQRNASTNKLTCCFKKAILQHQNEEVETSLSVLHFVPLNRKHRYYASATVLQCWLSRVKNVTAS